jgi:hypothetical protein
MGSLQDPETAGMIRVLSKDKEEAIIVEDYRRAKHLKDIISELHLVCCVYAIECIIMTSSSRPYE